MKRLISAILVLGLFFCYSIGSTTFLNRACDEISLALEVCAESINQKQYGKAKEMLDTVEDKWEENHLLLSIVLGDDVLSPPGKSIPAIVRDIKDENYTHALTVIRECQGYFEEIREGQRVNLENIF